MNQYILKIIFMLLTIKSFVMNLYKSFFEYFRLFCSLKIYNANYEQIGWLLYIRYMLIYILIQIKVIINLPIILNLIKLFDIDGTYVQISFYLNKSLNVIIYETTTNVIYNSMLDYKKYCDEHTTQRKKMMTTVVVSCKLLNKIDTYDITHLIKKYNEQNVVRHILGINGVNMNCYDNVEIKKMQNFKFVSNNTNINDFVMKKMSEL